MTAPLKAACQTFTWEMLGGGWTGDPDDLLRAIAAGGYAGIEITDKMIGRYSQRPAEFARALEARGLTLVAFAWASRSGFTEADAVSADLESMEAVLRFVGAFPGAHLSLGSATEVSEGLRARKFDVAARFYNAAAERGQRVGVQVAVHPSSHHGTLLSSRADYDALFARLDPVSVGWVPDTGHIIRGGQDLLDTLTTYRDRIRYLHLKDVDHDGRWQMLGTGVCPVATVIDLVRTAPNFNGWLVVEEESDAAGRDPAGAVARNRQTLATSGV